MEREKSLLKNTIVLAFGSYLPKLTALVTLPLLTGRLSKTEYGTYDLVNTLVFLLLPALTLQVQSAAFRFLISSRKQEERIKSIISTIFSFTIPVSILGLAITFFFIGGIQNSTKLFILLYFFCDIIYVTVGQIARGLGYNGIFAIGAIINSLVYMIGVCLSLLLFDAGLEGIVVSLAAGSIIGIAIIVVRVHLFSFVSAKHISIAQLKELLSYSWPMVPNALSNWVLSLSDRLVILAFLGIEANAVYAVANKIPNLVKTFQGNFTNAWQESASLAVEDEDKTKYYSKIFESINQMVTGLVALMISCTPLLFKILIRGDYDEAYLQMPFLFLGVYFSCMAAFMGGIYIAYMKTKSVGITTMAAAACNLIIDLSTMKLIGLYAASLSTLVSFALLFVYRLIDSQKFQKLSINYKKLIILILLLIVMCVLVGFRNIWLDLINALFGIILSVSINRHLVNKIISGSVKKVKNYFSKL